jgi:fatty-acyl-CoA synthase
VVVARAGATLHVSDIKDQVIRQAELGMVPKYAVPAQVFFLAELPKTSVGKLDKKKLREVFSSVVFAESV